MRIATVYLLKIFCMHCACLYEVKFTRKVMNIETKISEETFQLILDTNEHLIIQGDNALLQRKSDGEVVYVSTSYVRKIFNFPDNGPQNKTNEDTAHVLWTRNQILRLIEEYKTCQEMFKYTTVAMKEFGNI